MNTKKEEQLDLVTYSDEEREYLRSLLEEEFKNHPEVRIRFYPWNLNKGVHVKTETREFFFPLEWIHGNLRKNIFTEIEKIKELAERGF